MSMHVELGQEQIRIYRGVAAALLLSIAALGAAQVALPRLVSLPADDLQSRLVFWVSADLLISSASAWSLGEDDTRPRISADQLIRLRVRGSLSP